jgi:hypothetical protein
MSRENSGRFAKGCSGNPRGRPRKAKRTFTNEQVRDDFLLALEEKLAVPINGKVRKIPAIQVITKQLVMTAAKGDRHCMFRVLDIRHKMIAEMVNERLSLLQTYLETAKICKQQPEDTTDEMLGHLHAVRGMLQRDGLLH